MALVNGGYLYNVFRHTEFLYYTQKQKKRAFSESDHSLNNACFERKQILLRDDTSPSSSEVRVK